MERRQAIRRACAPAAAFLMFWALSVPLTAQPPDTSIPKAPPRAEGEGPFARLILRGVTLIDGTGSPPLGPVDIVIEKNRIVQIVKSVGSPGVDPDPEERPEGRTGRETARSTLDGLYVLPGLVDMHGHIGGKEQGTPAEYVFKLWMAHGVTTVRDPGSGNGVDWTVDARRRAPGTRSRRRASRPTSPSARGARPRSPRPRRPQWVARWPPRGADGVKFFG